MKTWTLFAVLSEKLSIFTALPIWINLNNECVLRFFLFNTTWKPTLFYRNCIFLTLNDDSAAHYTALRKVSFLFVFVKHRYQTGYQAPSPGHSPGGHGWNLDLPSSNQLWRKTNPAQSPPPHTHTSSTITLTFFSNSSAYFFNWPFLVRVGKGHSGISWVSMCVRYHWKITFF